MKDKVNFMSVLCLVLIMFSCSRVEHKKKFTYGKVENNIYTNSFFKFTITLPTGWIVQTKEQTNKIVSLGKISAVGNNKRLKAIIDASELRSTYLLTVFQHEVGAQVDYNPSLMIIVENIDFSPEIKTGKAYLNHTRTLIKQTPFHYNLDKKIDKININSNVLYVMNSSLEHKNMRIEQEYYSIIRNNFAISIVTSFSNEDQKESLKETLGTLRFEE